MKCTNCGIENADNVRVCVHCNEALFSGSHKDYKPTQSPFSNVRIEGGQGDTLETAIIIKGAADSSIGVAVEWAILHQIFGQKNKDWMFEGQSLHELNGHGYDLMRLALSDGSKRMIYFDVTDFYRGNAPAGSQIHGSDPFINKLILFLAVAIAAVFLVLFISFLFIK